MESEKLIDLRSDTVTQATIEMRTAIYHAKIGDHGYEEDEETLALEDYCAKLFGKQAAMFISSGTMSNQVAIRCYTKPGDEIILDTSYHINYFEAGPTVDLGKVYLNLCHTHDGILTVESIKQAIANKHRSQLYNQPTLICVENTINTFGGKIFPLNALKKIYHFAKEKNLPIHMDGARLLNACVATSVTPLEYASYADSVTLCFSKGLGAPYGSILVGTQRFIAEAKKFRKWYGGGLHQSGFMAAAALYAIQHNIKQLAIDHQLAKMFAALINEINVIRVDLEKVETNIIMFDISKLKMDANDFTKIMKLNNVLLYPWSKHIVRAVTHRGHTEQNITYAAIQISKICEKLEKNKKIGKDGKNVFYPIMQKPAEKLSANVENTL